ncbi:MAG TPA: GAF domain-containing sensor histidine kinase [Candidatus Limnocylindria bacterium]|nr:GAF domain-containing sensor histidine kinase [Candidatus Limnocylindria bacterium]
MTAQDFLSYVSQAIYLALFVVATVRFVRRPGWVSFDTFAFFAVIAVLLLAGDAARIFGFVNHPALNVLTWVGVTALPYILLRLVDDFRPQPRAVMVAAGLGFVVVAAVGFVAPQPFGVTGMVLVAYAAALGIYASVGFLREARRSTGVTRRRMQAVALGSVLLAVVLLLAGARVVLPAASEALALVSQIIGLALVTSYYVGFVTPPFMRRAWQEPTLRAMLAEAAELVQLPDARGLAARIEERARSATGADGAAVGLWDAEAQELVFDSHPVERRIKPGEFIAGRAFERQQQIFSTRAERDAPEHADEYRSSGMQAIAAAPITTAGRRFGVLVVYAARPPLFTDDILALIGLMSEQAALVLRSHELLREAAHVRAQAEMTRLKDDFLSVVAHDVRTPLTTILLNAELLERALDANSSNGRRAASVRTQAVRLKQLVEDYLDIVRTEGRRALRREEHDLVALVQDALTGMGTSAGRVKLTGEPELRGYFDGPRIEQLVQNLVNNALKYSNPGTPVEVDVSAQDGYAVLSVRDRGIGIAKSDLGLLFERFHRGQNTSDRTHRGLGLGLYICRQVASEHGGRIEVTSRVGEGSTFTVYLDRWSLESEEPELEPSAEEAAS